MPDMQISRWYELNNTPKSDLDFGAYFRHELHSERKPDHPEKHACQPVYPGLHRGTGLCAFRFPGSILLYADGFFHLNECMKHLPDALIEGRHGFGRQFRAEIFGPLEKMLLGKCLLLLP